MTPVGVFPRRLSAVIAGPDALPDDLRPRTSTRNLGVRNFIQSHDRSKI